MLPEIPVFPHSSRFKRWSFMPKIAAQRQIWLLIKLTLLERNVGFVHQRVGNRKWENSGWSLKTCSDYIALSGQEWIAVEPLHYSCDSCGVIQYSTFACVILLKWPGLFTKSYWEWHRAEHLPLGHLSATKRKLICKKWEMSREITHIDNVNWWAQWKVIQADKPSQWLRLFLSVEH